MPVDKPQEGCALCMDHREQVKQMAKKAKAKRKETDGTGYVFWCGYSQAVDELNDSTEATSGEEHESNDTST